MQRRTYILSDTHFQHSKIKEACDRPNDCDERIIRQWNHFVRKDDLVIHLGDVIFSNKTKLLETIKKLNGTKILVKGNHDKLSKSAYIESGFSAVVHSLIYEMNISGKKSYVILSHKPTPLNLEENWYNIHGHFHNCPRENWEPELVKRLTDKHYLFIIEDLKYRPILLNEAIDRGILPKTLNCGLERNKNEV
jgi:calcineurin-like phosphoesterase family protein